MACRAEAIDVPQPGQTVVDRRQRSRGHPPQGLVRAVEALEELAPADHHFRMRGAVDELEQRLRVFPHRHVHEQQRVHRRLNVGRAIALAREPPDEAAARLGERIHPVERIEEGLHARVALWRDYVTNVDLRQMPAHALPFAQMCFTSSGMS